MVRFADYPNLDQRTLNLSKKLMNLMKNTSLFIKDSDETEKFLLKTYNIKGPTFMSLKLIKNLIATGNEKD